MATNANIGYAFPFEKLGSDIARNEYNYQSILNGLIAWNNTTENDVTIRLTKDTDPWYEDYTIPSKKSIFDTSTFQCTTSGAVGSDLFAVGCKLETAVSGGSKIQITATFDSNSDVDSPGADQITLSDASDFAVDDEIKFEVSSGSLPTGITASTRYFINSIDYNTDAITVSSSIGGSTISLTPSASTTVTVTKRERPPQIDPDDPGDLVTFRLTVNNNGGSDWGLYYVPMIQDWVSGNDYKWGNVVRNGGFLYNVLFDIDNSTTAPISDGRNFSLITQTWVANQYYWENDIVMSSANSAYYRVTQNITGTTNIVDPSADTTGTFELYAPTWTTGTDYQAGQLVASAFGPSIYLALNTVVNSTTDPSVDTDNWQQTIIYRVPTSGVFTKSSIFRWQLPVDVEKFILKNESDSPSSSLTDINLRISARYKEPSSIYQRSVELLPSSNFAYYPDNQLAIWDSTATYGPTDTSIGITHRQNYSATMIFDHARPDLCKTVNFVNYDGPDLDQGLCIYLPVEVDVGDEGIATPEDGFTFEFFFRIWPDATLTDSTTRDHIINKSQIYVYSAGDRESIKNDNCGTPIAKFSMARTTNFYMFGENVAIPDKPVCYRATFVYSESQNKWCTLDYYQLPDHVFVGPVGFIDPQSPANLDINNTVIGNINPNASNIGYETAGFPLFQDPFSNPDLTPYRITGDENLDVFKNRII